MRLKSFRFQLIWILVGIPLLSYLILKPTFNLSLTGDDWQALYITWLDFDVRKAHSWFDLKAYLGPYNFSYYYLGILNNIFKENVSLYFYNSFFFRVLCTISIYFLTKYLTKSYLAGFLSSLIFILSVAGLETTNWVFNMNSYLGAFFFNFALIIFLKIRSSVKVIWSQYLIFALLLSVSFIVVSTRMHGAVPFILVLEFLLLLFIEKRKINLNFFLRITSPVVILLALIHLGVFGRVEQGGFTDRLNLGFNTAVSLIQQGEKIFLLYFPGIIGHVALPDFLYSSSTSLLGLRLSVFIYTFVILFLGLLTTTEGKLNKAKINPGFIILLLFSLFWIIITKLTFNLSLTKIAPDQVLSIIFGGQVLFFMPWLFFYLRIRHPQMAITAIFSWFYILSFTLIYWLFGPNVFIETTSRYLISAAIGFAIFWGAFLSFLIRNINPGLIGVALALLLLWLFINNNATSRYFTALERDRNAQLAKSIRQSLVESIGNLDIGNPSVFYFTSDNPYSLYWNLIFGFPPHMGLIYKIPNPDNTPLPETNYQTLLLYVKDGSPQKMNGRPIKPIPLDHVYAYHLTGDKLIPQTELIREKIKKDLQ